MNISLIEDEPECFENFEVLLRARGHDVVTYTEADEVVGNIANIAKSDLIILDLMLQLGSMISLAEGPETGIGIYRRIRKISKDVKILVVTARSKSEVWTEFAGDNVVHFLGKPVRDLETLASAVEEWNK